MESSVPGPTNQSVSIQDRAIDLELAKIRISRWLNAAAYIPAFKEDPSQIPRAIFISMEDISELVTKYQEYGLVGMRVYFGLAGEENPGPATSQDMRGLVVPVLAANETRPQVDLLSACDDINPEDTSIYDFTAPCPTYCDIASELYVPFEKTT